MPKCKYCGENITKFDKEICPFCGGKKPLEGVESYTVDITQTINTVDKKTVENYKQHSKLVNSLLCMFLGIFGADSFYLGHFKLGISRLLVGLIYIISLFCILYFAVNLEILYSLLISIGSIFIVYFILGIIGLFLNSRKDSNGAFLK